MHATRRSTCGIKSDVANKSCANTAFSVTFASSVHENNRGDCYFAGGPVCLNKRLPQFMAVNSPSAGSSSSFTQLNSRSRVPARRPMING
ncbi:hypothetical protein BDZ89DRAFT_1076380, partial [Hymenopellis radicata]